MKAKLIPALLVLVLGASVASGCGDDEKSSDTGAGAPPPSTTESTPPADTGSAGGGGDELKISADPSSLKFDTDKLDARAGKVTIVMDNPSSIPHAVGIEGSGVDEDGETVGQGEKSTATADLKPGDYTFYCPVAGHEEAGMKGALTVK